MTIVDSSAWIRHFSPRYAYDGVQKLLKANRVALHPYVFAELSMGGFSKNRETILQNLRTLPPVRSFEMEEVLQFIELQKLYGKGLSYIDAAILCSAVAFQYDILTFDDGLAAAAKKFHLKA
jgi:predicted nucleic acid-binding protein